ncbi:MULTISPECIES: GNAT family N-acetyltransferase [unclassified Streptomyces]|uniref:GNAT family N-acetyltransferase n=1 Tax=unclassified Streptomyces TaxID=2593676 RepID=UPI00094026A9|nr:GNAT family N-acetyltransferase [Streptomyces sp. TSRI0107]OKJ90316.1 acetyltransferase [Streptomyces sp. TSRI0107]
MNLELRHYTDVDPVRQTIVDIHVEVRQRDFGLVGPFYSAERFDERLSAHSAVAGWEAVVAYDGGEPAGFAYATPLGVGTRWWSAMTGPLPEGYTVETGKRTLALNEIVVRRAWRGTGLAHRIHEELLGGRGEERVTLLVNPRAGDGKVQAVYERWGYEKIGEQQPFADSPVFASMMREPLRRG